MSATALADERYVSVTTFKRDGTPVSTPVWCAGENGSLLVFSEAESGKVKRIRHDPHVRLAPCSARGRPHGDAVEADAAVIEETEKVEALLSKKYGWLWPAYNLLMAGTRRIRRQPAPRAVTIEITPR
jgi:uncharacterized protein